MTDDSGFTGGGATGPVLLLAVFAVFAVSMLSCGKRDYKVYTPPNYQAVQQPDGGSKLASEMGPGTGGEGEENGLNGRGIGLDDPVLADPADDVLNEVIRPFTDPRTGQTYDIVDGMVIIAFKNPPVLPVMDENYFDTERIQLDPYYSGTTYPLVVGDPQIDSFISAENLSVISEWRAHRAMGAQLPPTTTVEQAVSTWQAEYSSLIDSVDPDAISYADTLYWPDIDPDEERFNYCWSVCEWSSTTDYDIGAQMAWRNSKYGSSEVVVAVLDTGVQRLHPDLTSRLTSYGVNTFPRFGNTKFLINGGEPWPKLLNWSANNSKWLGHGTCVAGIIGASVNNDPDHVENDTDAVGITAYCKILPVAISATGTSSGVGFDEMSIINAFYALGAFKGELDKWQIWPQSTLPHYNIEVVNCSFGLPTYSKTYGDVVRTIAPYTLVVGSSGNANSSIDVNWPGKVDKGLSVAGYTKDGYRWIVPNHPDQGSNWNPYYVDIAAPAIDIPTTDMIGGSTWRVYGFADGGYNGSFSGTSAAAPHVSAVAALIASHTDKSTSQIRSTVITNHQQLNPLEHQLTYGGVDAARVFGYEHQGGVH